MINKLLKLLQDEPINEHASVLSYESGRLLETAMYIKWSSQGRLSADDKKILMGTLKSHLMDVMAQAWSLAIKVNCDPNEMLELGCEKAVSAIETKNNGNLQEHINDKW
jgi:predicted transcriptional regulator